MQRFLGILMLQTRFPRPLGDIGNPETFSFPVRRHIVEGASPGRVVRDQAHGLVDAFVAAARSLVDEGAAAIGTSCGFLALHQRRLSAAVTVPVASSSLLQCEWLARVLPAGQRPGIVTIDAVSLSEGHLQAVGVPPGTPIEGVDPDGELASRLLRDEPSLDMAKAEAEVVAASERLCRRANIGAVVLECTNMPPYARAVARATGRPVFDVVTLLNWIWSGLQRAG
jgi:hypothetical protein